MKTILKPLALIFILLATGCGFKPMYGDFSDGDELRGIMANIQIDPIQDAEGRDSKLGVVIRNSLLERVTPAGETTSASYILRVTYSVEEHGYGIREDESVTLQNLKLLLNYQLEDIATAKVVMENNARALVTYDLVRSDYSNKVAREASLDRLAQEVGNQVATRLGTWFRKQKTQ